MMAMNSVRTTLMRQRVVICSQNQDVRVMAEDDITCVRGLETVSRPELGLWLAKGVRPR